MFRGSIVLKTFALILFFALIYFLFLNFVFVNYVQDEIEGEYVAVLEKLNETLASELDSQTNDEATEASTEAAKEEASKTTEAEKTSEAVKEDASETVIKETASLSAGEDDELSSEQIEYINLAAALSAAQICVAASDGIIIYDTAGQSIGSTIKDSAQLSDKELDGVISTSSIDDKSLAVTRLVANGGAVSYVISIYDYSVIDSAVDDELVRYNTVGLIAFVIVLLVGLGTAIDSRMLLRKLTKLTVEYADGKFDNRVNLHFADEHQRLSDAIYCLAEKTQGLVEYQKDFVANVSHDFRSPLTSIKGYVGAIKDGTIPYENKDKYLDIILFEADRLTGLTQDLLQLNEIDNKALKLELTDFNVCSMVKQSARTFEAVCASKKLKIRLVFSERELWVNADKSKIQQVLHNLIDNAVKFSKEDSVIEITVSDKDMKVYVSVKDSGIGIPYESLDRIWERFYKTDLSRGKDKKGTGLGLAITKQIINAHGEKIEVASKVGVGTEFIFTLKQVSKPE
jgi:signal transduction histidine kinase